MDVAIVKGKILIYKLGGMLPAVLLSAGAAGSLDASGLCHDLGMAVVYPLPFACLNANDGVDIYTFIKKSREPMAAIMKSIEFFDSSAPTVALFSSKGPSIISPNILKPDITAPGLNILAAWPPVIPVSGVDGDARISAFNILSRTSMACPHVSNITAFVKKFHPTWSSSAIKSAIMTTENIGAEFSYGSGMIDPMKAVDPGLVYGHVRQTT